LQHDAATAVALMTPLSNAYGSLRRAESRPLWQATEVLLDDRMPAPMRLAWTLGAALFHYNLHQNARACQYARAALPLARQLGDKLRLARALGLIAARDETASAEERRAAFDEMLALQTPDEPLLARVNDAQAEFVYANSVADLDRCEAAGQRWLDLTRAPGWEYERGVALTNLADLALARGHTGQAVQIGRELEVQLRSTRHVRSLAIARTNLVTALLACDDVAGAREMAELGWPMATNWQLQPFWGVTLSLLAALEGRPRASAGLHGYAQARLAAAGVVAETNEARALQRGQALARAALGDAVVDALCRTGEAWSDEMAGAAGLARADIA
jgi:hypothetical protein